MNADHFKRPELHFEVWNSISRQTLSLELHFEVQNSISRQTIKSETPLEADYMIFRRSGSPEKVDRVISKVWNSNLKQTVVQNSFRGGLYNILKSGTPLEADYDISKVQTKPGLHSKILDVEILSAVRFLEEILKVYGF
ncbi:hypothetical protein RCL_jg5672.t2 [Rhizophagus clarus]|nr:hypothetical protein RCL_jg5672.t2 [Rhizophagus clarus]